MSEWPRVCQMGLHKHQGIPAVDKWSHPKFGTIYTCREHTIGRGPDLRAHSLKWEPLPASELAQPTSEREQP